MSDKKQPKATSKKPIEFVNIGEKYAKKVAKANRMEIRAVWGSKEKQLEIQ